MEHSPVRILIVDNSAFMRYTLSRRLSDLPDLSVVGTAHDGKDTLTLIPKLQPDVITLDVEMPHMDGLTTLREIMANFPRPVIMVSSLTSDGARETIQALTFGAVDFIAKPGAIANIDTIVDEVALKIRRAAGIHVPNVPKTSLPSLPPAVVVKAKGTRPMRENDKIVVIGTSTGGPRALHTVLEKFPASMEAAVIIIQHMPAGFTRSLAERLDSICPLAVKEAAVGDKPEIGRCLVAPGGFHLTLDSNGLVALNQNPPVHGVRPAVDVTMASVAKRFGANTIGVILTGMGNDGVNGAGLIRSSGGYIIAEDESTSVVWGMPRSVIEAGLANQVAPLPEVASAIVKALSA